MRNDFKSLVVNHVEKAVIIIFDRPEIRSPLSGFVIRELSQVLDTVEAGTSEKVIFTGSGGVFASGADLREIAELTVEQAPDFARRGQSLMNRIARLSQLTIAAIDGPCFGGALDLALACNRRLATQRSIFAHPGTGLGIITGWGGTQRLPRLIGQGLALEMFFTAGRFTADEAFRMKLIDELVDDPVAAALKAV
jgi:enoyl-CoA hydratase